MTDDSRGLTPAGVVLLILRWRAALLAGVLIGAGAAAGWTAWRGEVEAELSFAPESAPVSRSATMAQQLGLPVGGAAGGTVDFFQRVLVSRAVLARVIAADSFDYAVEFGLYGSGPGAERRAMADLRGRVTVIAEAIPGVVVVRVRAPDARRAEVVAARLFAALQLFNGTQRSSRSRNVLRAAEAELAAAQQRLAALEDSLSRGGHAAGPLSQRVAAERTLLTELRAAVVRARLDDVADTPALTLVDAPYGSARARLEPGRAAVLGALMGMAIALLVLVVVEWLRADVARHSVEYSMLRQQHPLVARLLGRIRTSPPPAS